MASKKPLIPQPATVRQLTDTLILPEVPAYSGEVDFSGLRYATTFSGPEVTNRRKITPDTDGFVAFDVGAGTGVKIDNISLVITGERADRYDADKLISFGFDEHADKLMTIVNSAYAMQPIDKSWTEMPVYSITPEQYLELQHREITDRNIRKAKQELNQAADVIASEKHEVTVGGEKYYISCFQYIKPISKKNPVLLFKMTPDWYKLISRSRMHYNLGILALTGNPYRMAFALAQHYAMDNNQSSQRYRHFKVANLLTHLPGIPTYDEIQGSPNTKGQWKRRIRDPFESALDKMVDEGILQWEYCLAKGAPLSDSTSELEKYQSWSECYIQFDFKDYPDQTPRLQAKATERKQKQAAADKKAERAAYMREYRKKKKKQG